jgi:hypothetical protein
MLENYNIVDILTGNIDAVKIYNLTHTSGYKIGNRIKKIMLNIGKMSDYINGTSVDQCKVLSCINGITIATAKLIVGKLKFIDIIQLKFSVGDIANIQKSDIRKVGKSIESSIRFIFTVNNIQKDTTTNI